MGSLFKVGVAYVPQLSVKQLFRSGIPIYISFDDYHPKLLPLWVELGLPLDLLQGVLMRPERKRHTEECLILRQL